MKIRGYYFVCTIVEEDLSEREEVWDLTNPDEAVQAVQTMVNAFENEYYYAEDLLGQLEHPIISKN